MMKATQGKKLAAISLLFFVLPTAIPFTPTAVTNVATATTVAEPSAFEQALNKSWEQAFHTQLRQWLNQLSANDAEFHSWSTATYQYEALAPGSRLWVITLFPQKKEADTSSPIGYLIVGETAHAEHAQEPEQKQEQEAHLIFKLLEYGLGSPPFHDKQHGMTAVYGGLESYWQGKNLVIDATSGEIYPFYPAEPGFAKKPALAQEPSPDAAQLGSSAIGPGIAPGQRLTGSAHWRNISDPFADIFWLTQPVNSPLSAEQLMQTDHDIPVVLVARLYQGKVLAPYPVTGFHLWDNQLFVAVRDQGERYLPFQHYARLGAFLAAGQAEENQAEQ